MPQSAIENDSLSLDGQSSGISTRDHAFQIDAVSSADMDHASGGGDHPLPLIEKPALVLDVNNASPDESGRSNASYAIRCQQGIIDTLSRYVDLAPGSSSITEAIGT